MILFSILIPSIPSRFGMAMKLYRKLESQASGLPVEILMLVDNKCRTIGEKRDALVKMSKAKFCAFCDDDDDVSDDYVGSIASAACENVDVIVFDQLTTINGSAPFKVSFGLGNENQEATQNENGNWIDIVRPPYHVCAWRTELAKSERIPPLQYGEDFAWISKLLPKAKTQHRINKVLHYYHYDDRVTEAK